MADTDVLITGERSKLPADIASLLDPAVPLPPGVEFFERRYDLSDVTTRLVWGIGLSLGALIVIPIGVAWLLHPGPTTVYSKWDFGVIGFGLVLALAAWMSFSSVAACWRLRAQQLVGRSIRYGTFLTPAALVQASDSDTTVIPPGRFRGLHGSTIKYFHNGQEKSFNLQQQVVRGTVEQLHESIRRWAASGSGHG